MMNGSPQRDGCRWLRGYLRGSWLAIIGCMILAAIESISLMPIAWLVRRAFDHVIPSRDLHRLLVLGCQLLSLVLIANALTLLTRFASLRTTKQVIGRIRSDLVVRFCTSSTAFHKAAHDGEIHALIVEDTQHVDVMLNAVIANCVPSMILSSALLLILSVLNWKLVVVLSLVMPPLFVVHRRLEQRARELVRTNRNSFVRFSGGIQSLLQRANLAVAQGAERFEIEQHCENIDSLRTDSQKMAWHNAALTLFHSAMVTAASVTTLVVGGMEVAVGKSTVGSLLSFYVVMTLLAGRLQQLFSAMPHLLEGGHAMTSLASAAEGFPRPPYTGTRRIRFRERVEFRDVSFGYGAVPLLEYVSLELTRGSLFAVVGPNGVGKTTLAQLILGICRPQQGMVLADGVPYDEIDMQELRQSISYAAQDAVIFSGTIWENITYGVSDPKPDAVMEACRLAQLDNFIESLPDGYETRIGERGATLSGGQRQKISIARALLRDACLLILDEPTNHLDEESAKRLLENIATLPARPSVLVITQDPRVLDAIPRRVMFDNRRVIQKNDLSTLFQDSHWTVMGEMK